jgi:hypothetical protein
VPFYCATCGASYCAEHWKATVHGDEAGAGYRDAPPDTDDTMTLECPAGHEQKML